MFTHSFNGVVPFTRFDGQPWTHILVEQAAEQHGPFTQIDRQPLAPDPTPETAAPVNITTTAATLDTGWFRFRFEDSDGSLSPATDAVRSPAGTGDLPFMPTVQQVANLLRARTTRLANTTRTDDIQVGDEVGTFDATTRPTSVQVQELISQAGDMVAARFAGYYDDLEPGHITQLTALRAAMLVESSFFPEQTSDGRGSYDQLRVEFDDTAGLVTRLIGQGQDTGRPTTLTVVPVRSSVYREPIVPVPPAV